MWGWGSEYCPVLEVPVALPQEVKDEASEEKSLNECVDELTTKVDKLEQKLNEVETFYFGSHAKQTSKVDCKDQEKSVPGFKEKQQEAAGKEAAAAERMQELKHQFGTILRQITQHQWAEPFLEPVDVVGLKLHDYYQIIEKPMDFSTIKRKMEAKGSAGYKNVREMCADVRLIFRNAMKYNNERHDVHIMAKVLLDKFEAKWLQLLPKVDEEEKRQKKEAAEMQYHILLAQETVQARIAREIGLDLDEVDGQLEKLRETVLQKCRKISSTEKKRIWSAITKLSPEDINKAVEIVAKGNPNFHATAETVEIDIDAQSESTLWKLKFFIRDTLQAKMKGEGIENSHDENSNRNKRKREICFALPKTSQKLS